MAKFQIVKGSTSVILPVFIQDSSSTTGAGLGSLDQTSSIVGGYVKRDGVGVALAVDENVTTEGTYEAPTTAAQVRIGTPANMRTGSYELHFHNDLFTTADWVTISLGGATNMADIFIEVQLTGMDVNDGVRGGMTSMPSAVPGAAGGMFIAGTNAATTVTTSFTTTFTGNLSGSVGSVTGAVGSVTGAVGSVTGAVGSVAGNVDGNVTGSVGSLVGHTVQTADHTANIASILTDTGTTIPARITTAQNDLDTITGTGGVLIGTDALTEAYAADGAAATTPELLYMIWSAVSEFAVGGTTITAKKLDGATTAMTFTLDDATDPTSRTRAT